jgi:hypothetical protein
MSYVTSQSDCRKIRDLPFCYLCGEPFSEADVTDHDHVPPESVFAKEDRNFPIKLRTHKDRCHAPLSQDDAVLGQLVALIHGKAPSASADKLNITILEDPDSGATTGLFRERNIEYLLRRWIQGFHAALYQSYLPKAAKFAIQSPFPSTDDGVEADPIRDQHFAFITSIKKNRAAGNVDRIETNNGKLRYECVWDKLSDGSWCCIFALELYNWADLGDINNYPRRGCAGLYSPSFAVPPPTAHKATKLIFDIAQSDHADPF